ncbi:MAG: acyl-ACP--UDP-N-acetylglucosamine O-acyltransferase [Abditibacteriota bacterium]|nr:acyl-ACP--UDP-N-acetylglucosamine O-acyltransferase [Abditibacteriota bacterium]
MTDIHNSAIIAPDARIGENVKIGPYCVIGENVVIGDGTCLMSNVVIQKDTTIGKNNVIHSGAVLGGDPQDLKYNGEQSFLEIGDDNQIREYVTIHRGSHEGQTTVIGDSNLLMACSHIGHDVTVRNHVICANYVGVSGHCVIEDYAIIGGLAGLHQFVRVGKMAMIGGLSKVNIDIPPFTLCDGNPLRVRSINSVGLRRRGIDKESIDILREAVRVLSNSGLNRKTALNLIGELPSIPELQYLSDFVCATREGYSGRQEQVK